MYTKFRDFLEGKNKLCIIQAENPDGDSLGTALALDYLLSDKEISLYCPVDIPKYLRYFTDWSRVTNEFDYKADGYIIVDTAAEVLLSMGMHCLGCPSARGETIGQACEVHGVDVEEILAQINAL